MWFTLFLVFFDGAASAALYQPEALDQLLQSVSIAGQAGKQPVVIFDLDDTLINSRSRTQRILRDFARQTEVRARYPHEAEIALHLHLRRIGYYVGETLREAGISAPGFLKLAESFWADGFYSNRYCAQDLTLPGAVEYVQAIHDAGALVVYLTGRDRPRMQDCTLRNLRRRGFPMGARTRLLMKPDQEEDDLRFKQESFAWIGAQGEVAGGFENEPANINAYQATFPAGLMIYVDTVHSSRPEVPAPGIPWIKNFRWAELRATSR